MRLSQPERQNATPHARRPVGLSPAHLYIRMSAFVVFVLLAGIAGGILIERDVIAPGRDKDAFPDLQAVVDVIDNNYYYRPTDDVESDALSREMEQQAIVGLLSTLGDDYTRYLSVDQSETAAEDLEGRYGGTGVDVSLMSNQVVVSNIVPGSPAEEAGIVRGDVLQRIDDLVVDPGNWDGLIRQLRGDVGSTVKLSLVRPGTSRSFDVDIVREEIVVPPVTFRMIDGTTIGWIQVTIFGDQTTAGVDEALAEAKAAGATGLVLDLRGNGGGWVTSAQEVLARFLPTDAGPAMYEDVTPGRGGEEPMPLLAEGATPTDLPMVVLVDRGTASASEIVAGALKDYNRALVIGERTYGKGSVQRIFSFSDGSTLRVTVAEWFTPSKGRIQDEGIRPDLEVSFESHAATGDDPVLAAAISMLKSNRSRPTDLTEPPVATPPATP